MLHLCAMLAVVGMAWNSRTCYAQDNSVKSVPISETSTTTPVTPVHLSEKQAADFGLALEAIATQAKVVLIAEGLPLNAVLSPEETRPLAKLAPVEELVDRVAAAYDYRVVRVKASRKPDALDVRPQPHVFVLVKKYTNPEDLPDVTLEECQAAMRDVNQMLLSASPNPPIRVNTPFILSIADSLTPEIEARLKGGIPVSELPNGINNRIKQFGIHLYAGMRQSDAFSALAALTGMDEATLSYQDYRGKKEIGFDNCLARNQDGATARYPRLLRHLVSIVGEYISTSKDAAEPPPQEPVIKESNKPFPPERILGAVNLQDALARLTPDTNSSFVVDPILADKKVILAGVSYGPAKEVAEGLAQVYGLRVARISSDSIDKYRITRRIAPFPQRPAGVFELVRQTLPEPLLHATFDGEQEARVHASFKAYTTEDKSLSYEERIKRFREGGKKFQEEQQRIRGAAMYMRAAAAKKLQIEGEQVLAEQPKGVRFVALPRSMKNNYGIIAISNFIESLNSVPATPDYINDWDNAVISGGPFVDPNSHKPRYSIQFMGRDKDGNPHEEATYIVWDNRPNAQQAMP